MRDFRYLDVWHKAHAFTLHAFRATDHFPRAKTLGFAGTIRRSATTLTMKIAEGCGHDSDVDYLRVCSTLALSAWESNSRCFLRATFSFSTRLSTRRYRVNS